MIRPKVILTAESVVRDAQTNRVSVFNIHENFPTIGFPLLIPRFTIFIMLERENGDTSTPPARMIIRLGDNILFEQAIEVNFGTGLITRAIAEFQGFVLPGPGVLQVSIEVAGETVSSYQMPVTASGTPAPHIINQ